MLRLFTDTDTDMTPQLAAKYGYKLISMPYSIDGQLICPYEDYTEFDYRTYYNLLREGTIPTTSAVTRERYIEYFEPDFAEGNDILYVHFSRTMSSTFENMDAAMKELHEKYPERKLYTIDTKSISVNSLNMLFEIGDMYIEGKTIDEIMAWADENVQKFATYFFVDDLKFLKRSGRVSGISAAMGTMLGVRPIIHMSPEGRMPVIGKERGRRRALEALADHMEAIAEDIHDHRIMISHTDNEDVVDELIEILKERFGQETVVEKYIVNPTSGAHAGPNSMGLSFHCKHR